MTYHYTYLITNLNPSTTEKYYIGVRSCSCLPENDNYMGSSSLLKEDITKIGIESFEKVIIEIWDTRELASLNEEWLHGYYNVADSTEFYNRRNARGNFTVTLDSIAKMTKTINDPAYKHKKKLSTEKANITRQNPKWKETIGKQQKAKYKETIHSQAWKNSTGIIRSNKIRDKRLDYKWKNTVGAIAKKSEMNTKSNALWLEEVWKPAMQQRITNINSKEWKSTSGVIQKERYQETINSDKYIQDTLPKLKAKLKSTLNSEEYKKKHTYTCPHCNYNGVGPANFKRWHGDNCKYKYNYAK